MTDDTEETDDFSIIWAPKRVLDIEWDDAGAVALIGYGPGEWEQVIKAAVARGQT